VEPSAPLEEEAMLMPLAEAVPIPEQYVEVQAPADLPANYELTVQLDGSSSSAVVVVERAFRQRGRFTRSRFSHRII